MFGKVAYFNQNNNEGEILGENKNTYPFHIGEWLSIKSIKVGQKVFYNVEENEARNIKIDKEYIVYIKVHLHEIINHI